MTNKVSNRSWIQIFLTFLLGRKSPNEKLFALHDYESTNARKYLSFAKNDDFELLDSMDQRWWRVKHLQSGRRGLVPSNYVAKAADKEIAEWVNLDFTSQDAEKRLRQEKYQPGAFLIRCSSEINNWQNLRLSVKHSSNIIRHYPIVREGSQFSITGDRNRTMSFPTLSKLVQYNARYSGGVTQRLIFSVKKKIDAWEIDTHEISIDWDKKELGSGHFGEVRSAKLDGRHVALKTLILGRGMDKDQFIQEAVTARRLDHDNITRTIGVCTAGPYIVTEFLAGGALKSYLQGMKSNNNRLTESEYVSVASKIASAMAHLENNNVVHRDLAARNILVGTSLEIVKLADFGMARYLDDSIYYKTHKDVFPLKWTAPEAFVIIDDNDVIVQPGRSTSKSDVWSYAVVLWELYSMGANPYDGKNVREIYGYLMAENVPLECPTNCPPNSIYQLMLKCWSLAPADRPTFAQIVTYLDEYSAGSGLSVANTENSV